MKGADYNWEEHSGDLKFKGHKVCNSGIKVESINRPFNGKSSQALTRGLTLGSKFDYVVFDSKSGSKLVKNIECPFSFYWKSKLFCTPKNVSQIKADVLYET